MEYKRVIFSGHALRRMFEQGISRAEVLEVIKDGTIIAEYPDDTPCPSSLILGIVEGRPLHTVAALEAQTRTCYVVTAYEPAPELWDEGFRNRRRT